MCKSVCSGGARVSSHSLLHLIPLLRFACGFSGLCAETKGKGLPLLGRGIKAADELARQKTQLAAKRLPTLLGCDSLGLHLFSPHLAGTFSN